MNPLQVPQVPPSDEPLDILLGSLRPSLEEGTYVDEKRMQVNEGALCR